MLVISTQRNEKVSRVWSWSLVKTNSGSHRPRKKREQHRRKSPCCKKMNPFQPGSVEKNLVQEEKEREQGTEIAWTFPERAAMCEPHMAGGGVIHLFGVMSMV
mmetsp:Transcript_4068/g.8898  ORF Transcript_4068/g.8898 Transcript_4068/m.8898 type:complete len:103 (+) Transcript_4068:103-411(+)